MHAYMLEKIHHRHAAMLPETAAQICLIDKEMLRELIQG